MERFVYFDTFNGAAGDMIVGALIDLGVPLDYLQTELAKLGLGSFRLEALPVERQGLKGNDFKVAAAAPPPGAHSHNSFAEIRRVIEESPLDGWVRDKSIQIFRRLAEAEAEVHGSPVEEVHFHEVGAVDSVVDVVGACLGFRYLDITLFFSGPIALGGGTIHFSHGNWPVPAPATEKLLAGFPVKWGPVEAELTTPTGAAIITALTQPGQQPQVVNLEKSGWGAGDRRFDEVPNMLRLLLGRVSSNGEVPAPSELASEGTQEIVLLEASIDDSDPQMLGHFMDRALSTGALDVYYAPLHMKKNRPGVLLSLLCQREDLDRMAELVFRETTTLGVRWSPRRRHALDRETRQVQSSLGLVAVKIGRLNGHVVNVWPEFEDIRELSLRHDLPLKVVRQRVLSELKELLDE